MPITTTSIGPNSRQIDIVDETRIGPITTAIDDAVTTMGWTLFDTVSTGARNCMITKVYRAPNNDGPNATNKFVILRFDAPKCSIYMSCAEGWNETTHVATNESYNFTRSFPMTLQTSNMQFYIFATARYFVMQTRFLGELGVWQGVFEWERNTANIPQDTSTTGAPCFGYTNSVIFNEPTYNTNNVNSEIAGWNCIVPPRTLDGFTGWGASKTYAINTLRGKTTPHLGTSINENSTTYGTTTDTTLTRAFNKGFFTFLDGNRNAVINPTLSSRFETYIDTGRIYGITMVPPSGRGLDTLDIPIDSNGFYDANGTTTTHYMFNLCGGNVNNYSLATGNVKVELLGAANAPVNNSAISRGVVVRGKFLFVLEFQGNKIFKYDLVGKSWSQIDFAVTTVFGGTDLIYDGEDHIYIARSGGATNYITRINVDTNAEVSLLLNGVALTPSALGVDDANLYVGVSHPISNASTSPPTRVYSLSTFSASATHSATLTPPLTAPFNLTNIVRSIETADYSGAVFVLYDLWSTISAGVGTTPKMARFNPNGTLVSSAPTTALISAPGGPAETRNYIIFDGNNFVCLPFYWVSSTNYGVLLPVVLNTNAQPIIFTANNGAQQNAMGTISQAVMASANIQPSPYPVVWRGRLGILAMRPDVTVSNFGRYLFSPAFDNWAVTQPPPARRSYSNNANTTSITASLVLPMQNFFTAPFNSQHNTLIGDNTFLYAIGSSISANPTRNLVISGQQTNTSSLGAPTPSILIRG